MNNIKRKIYLYVSLNDFGGGFSYSVTTTGDMDSVGWLLLDTKEIEFEYDDIDYTGLLKQKKLDAALAEQENIAAKVLELTQ